MEFKNIKKIPKALISGVGKIIYGSYATPSFFHEKDKRYINNGSIECYTIGGCLIGTIADLIIVGGAVSLINHFSEKSIEPSFLYLITPHLITNISSGMYEHARRMISNRKIKKGNKRLENLEIINFDTSGL